MPFQLGTRPEFFGVDEPVRLANLGPGTVYWHLTDSTVSQSNNQGTIAPNTSTTFNPQGVWIVGSATTDLQPANVTATGGALAGAPSGPAGGDLTTTYPNPVIGPGVVTAAKIASGTITDAQIAAANKDGIAGLPSLRTLGTGAQQALPGNTALTPTGAAAGDLAGTYPSPTVKGLVRVYNVKDVAYGAKGDNSTDDTTAINLALTAAKTAGGGIVYIPPGRYILNTFRDFSGLQWALEMTGDNVQLVGAGASTVLVTTANSVGGVCTILLTGAGKNNNLSSWLTYRCSSATVYPMSPVTVVGANTVTLTTPSNANNFAVGDACYIRTGETTSGTRSLPAEPDAELNEIQAINATTGVLTLRWPLRKLYSQEYWADATTNNSTATTPTTAWPALMGVANVQDRVIRRTGVRNLRFEHQNPSGTGYAMQRLGVIDTHIKQVSGLIEDQGFTILDGGRDIVDDDIKITFTGGSNGFHWPDAVANGVSDMIVTNLIARALKGTVELHIQEGAAGITFIAPKLLSAPDATTNRSIIGINGRGYGIDVISPEIVNSPVGSAININDFNPTGPLRGYGRVTNPVIRGTVASPCISVATPGWRITDPDVPDGNLVDLNTSAAQMRTIQEVPVITKACRILFSDTDVPLFTLPPDSYLRNVILQVLTPFNAATTNTIQVGTPGSHNAFFQDTTVGTAGIKTTALYGNGVMTAAQNVHVYYAQTGAAATTGVAVVIVEYSRIPTT